MPFIDEEPLPWYPENDGASMVDLSYMVRIWLDLDYMVKFMANLNCMVRIGLDLDYMVKSMLDLNYAKS